TVTFAPGETTRTILVATVDDTIAEPTETFTVTLSNPVGATLARSQGAATILDRDITLSNSSVAEHLPAATTVGTLTAVDPTNPAGPFTFSLVNDGVHDADNAKFTVSGNSLKTTAELSFDVRT